MKKPKIDFDYYAISITDTGIDVEKVSGCEQIFINTDWKSGNCYPTAKSAKAVAREIKALMKERSRAA